MNYYIDKVEPPPSLMTGPSPPGAMSGREAYERVVTSLAFLVWEFEWQEKTQNEHLQARGPGW